MVNGVEVTKEGICHVTDYIHVVNGKIICFNKSALDMDNPDDVRDLVELGRVLYEGDGLERKYGNDSICLILGHGEDLVIDVACVDGMPDKYRGVLRKVVGELYG